MKIIKRNQLAMLSIAFMIMIAGYINYKYDPSREENLGQTVRVDSDGVYVYTNENVDIYEEAVDSINKNDTIYNTKDNDTKLSEFKDSRNNMFSELEESYKNVISKSVDSEETKIYQEKLDDVIKKKHLIEIVEGILKAKGITDIAIVPTEDKYNVMVSLEEKLTDTQANMIKKIIEEEFDIDSKDITIIEK